MRILFINYEYPPLGGGGGIVNEYLAEELAGRHEVTVLTSRAFDLAEREARNGVEILRSWTAFRAERPAATIASMAAFVVSGAFRGAGLVRSRKFDVINTHFVLPTGPVGALLAGLGNIPNVLSVHGGDLYDPSKKLSPHRHALLRSAIRYVSRRADAIVGQSENTNANLKQFYDAELEPELIPLGIPRPAGPATDRAGLGFDADDIILVAVGRLVGRKRVDQLIRLVAELDDPRVRLLVVGDGPESVSLARQAKALGVQDRVTLAGYVTEQQKVDFLAAADIYVSTSQHEGFGLVFLEGMAQGLPVVCYDHGGQTDYLTDGINGAVIPLNDFDRFVASVRELVGDPGRRAAMSARNLEDVEKYFIDNCARRYEELFEQVIARSRR